MTAYAFPAADGPRALKPLSGPEKSAILLSLIKPEHVDRILDVLPSEQAARIAQVFKLSRSEVDTSLTAENLERVLVEVLSADFGDDSYVQRVNQLNEMAAADPNLFASCFLTQWYAPDVVQAEKGGQPKDKGKIGGVVALGLLGLSKIKLLMPVGSILLSIGAYALLWGWQFAAGFVALLFAHEYGHVLAARREGVKASAPYFIPFLGAAILMNAKDLQADPVREAKIGLAGPIFGTTACLIPWGLYAATGDQLFLALTFTGFVLNLFNLIPFLPLDGGRAMAVTGTGVWLMIGLPLVVILAIVSFHWIFVLILFMGLAELYGRSSERRMYKRNGVEPPAKPKVTFKSRAMVFATYLLLVAGLFAGAYATHLSPDELDAAQHQQSAQAR